MAFDFKKEYKEIYLPDKKPDIILVPKMNYIAVRGQGDPNQEDGEYKQAIGLLYGIAFTIKMSKKGGYFVMLANNKTNKGRCTLRVAAFYIISHNCCYFVFADGIIRLTLNVWSGYAIKPVEEKCQTLSGEFGGRHREGIV